jgi:RNA polymerase sigma-70 factor, ECF subfamily
MQNNEMAGLISRVAIGDCQAFTDLFRVTSPKLLLSAFGS